MNILLKEKKYSLLGFESEAEFEKAVIENSAHLFGKDTVYIDTKMRVGETESYHKTIPDAFLIDFTNKKYPQLYFVENELSSHDVYAHISEQLVRFMGAINTSKNQIRNKILQAIKGDADMVKRINQYLKDSPFANIDELMNFLTDKEIRIVVVIDDKSTDLENSLKVFREKPDVATLQRYTYDKDVAYSVEPMREEVSDIEEIERISDGGDVQFDTIVCPAFEEGFKHAYVDNDAWWEIRISHEMRDKLKYLAIYEKLPVAAVRNVAEIERIEPYKDSGKFKVYLKNKKKVGPITLDKGKRGVAPQGPRYTTYEKILRAKKLSDLW